MINLIKGRVKEEIYTYNRMEYCKKKENNGSSFYYRPAGNWNCLSFEEKNLNSLNHLLECDELQDRLAIELKESISLAFSDESMEKLQRVQVKYDIEFKE